MEFKELVTVNLDIAMKAAIPIIIARVLSAPFYDRSIFKGSILAGIIGRMKYYTSYGGVFVLFALIHAASFKVTTIDYLSILGNIQLGCYVILIFLELLGVSLKNSITSYRLARSFIFRSRYLTSLVHSIILANVFSPIFVVGVVVRKDEYNNTSYAVGVLIILFLYWLYIESNYGILNKIFKNSYTIYVELADGSVIECSDILESKSFYIIRQSHRIKSKKLVTEFRIPKERMITVVSRTVISE